ncbi:MAG: RNA polymerase sigma factor [Mariprofundaceae bacterium]|nr:RNA polymerase sigma factor [Mariprofundaceae bacterium]
MATPDKSTDEDLMLGYKDGSSTAFEQLYLRHKGSLYRFMLRSCDSKDIAEELFQDVWVSVIKSRSSYKTSALFTTWLYRIASNRLTDHYRKSGKWDQYIDRAGEEASDENNCAVTAAYEQPEHQAAINQQIQRLLFCLEQLPALQRQVFLLREEAGLKLEEIANAIEANKEAVKSRMRYAINRLRHCMGEAS